jgi:GNAT superfamily N-acetyltransferase
MTIRHAVIGDIPQMHSVRMGVVENQLTKPLSIEPHHYRSLLGSGRGWVCELDERIVGFAIADLEHSSIWALFVRPDYEGRGIGRRLHDAAIEWLFANGATRIWLTTDPNTRAEHFYRSAHWAYVGRQPNGESRYEMTADQFAERST